MTSHRLRVEEVTTIACIPPPTDLFVDVVAEAASVPPPPLALTPAGCSHVVSPVACTRAARLNSAQPRTHRAQAQTHAQHETQTHLVHIELRSTFGVNLFRPRHLWCCGGRIAYPTAAQLRAAQPTALKAHAPASTVASASASSASARRCPRATHVTRTHSARNKTLPRTLGSTNVTSPDLGCRQHFVPVLSSMLSTHSYRINHA